jgi:hypothetical protein
MLIIGRGWRVIKSMQSRHEGVHGRASNKSLVLVHEHVEEIHQGKNARSHPSGRHLLHIVIGQLPEVSFNGPVDDSAFAPNCGSGLGCYKVSLNT